MLGLSEDYTVFDIDVIIHINSVFSILSQLGVGPDAGFSIEDQTASWTDFFGSDIKLSDIKTYVYLKVKTYFDPPTNPRVFDAIDKQILEYEWRISVHRESTKWSDNFIGPIGTPFDIQYGIPINRKIIVANNKVLWTSLDSFRPAFLLKKSNEKNATVIQDLSQYMSSSFDSNNIVLTWSMKPSDISFLTSGYYDLKIKTITMILSKLYKFLADNLELQPDVYGCWNYSCSH